MKGLIACIRKDICLFFSAAGVFSLLLPLILAAALSIGLSDSASANLTVKSFAIAVADEDESVMSRSLIKQLSRIELFSEVRRITPPNASEDVLFTNELEDVAAVIVIPSGYFYSLYRMDGMPVTVCLNSKKQLESSLTKTILDSVSSIIFSERNAWFAAYSLSHEGEMYGATYREFCDSAATSIIESALGRGNLFNDISDAPIDRVQNSFTACCLCMAIFFCSFCVVKTIPEEFGMGVLERFTLLGGSMSSMIFSKCICAMLFSLLGFLPVAVILGSGFNAKLVWIFMITFAACFAFSLFLSLVIRNRECYMMVSALITLLELFFGGTIYPVKLFPPFAKFLSVISIPTYALNGLNGKHFILPLSVITILFTSLSVGVIVIRANSIFNFMIRRKDGRTKC